MRLWSKILAAGLLGVLSTASASADIILHKILRPLRVEEDGSGDYDRVVAAILAETTVAVTIVLSPIKRVYRDYEQAEKVCSIPNNLNIVLENNPNHQKADFINSVPLDLVSGHIISRPYEEIARSLADIEDKRVAAWWAVPKEQYLSPTGANIIPVADERHAMQLLMAKRVDFAWGWVPDTLMLYAKMGHDSPLLDLRFSLMALPATFVCKRSPETQKFLDEVNVIIETMRKDGRLKKLFSPHARIIGIDVPWSTLEE